MKSIRFASIITLAVLASGCVARVESPPPPPPVAIQAPPPTAAPAGYAPDYYVWDGSEYVGVVGDNYVYWSGGAWVVCPPFVIARFHGWEGHHPEWRRHAYHYHREREWRR